MHLLVVHDEVNGFVVTIAWTFSARIDHHVASPKEIRCDEYYFRRFSFAVNDSPPAPQQGQLMATRMPCFCSSSRSVRSSIARACCANRSCRENPLALVASPDDGGGELPNASGGGGGANVPLLGRMLLGRLAMAGAYYLRTIFTISSMSPRRKQAMLCSTVGSARSA